MITFMFSLEVEMVKNIIRRLLDAGLEPQCIQVCCMYRGQVALTKVGR